MTKRTANIRIPFELHQWLKKEKQKTKRSIPDLTEDIFNSWIFKDKKLKLRTRIIKEYSFP